MALLNLNKKLTQWVCNLTHKSQLSLNNNIHNYNRKWDLPRTKDSTTSIISVMLNNSYFINNKCKDKCQTAWLHLQRHKVIVSSLRELILSEVVTNKKNSKDKVLITISSHIPLQAWIHTHSPLSNKIKILVTCHKHILLIQGDHKQVSHMSNNKHPHLKPIATHQWIYSGPSKKLTYLSMMNKQHITLKEDKCFKSLNLEHLCLKNSNKS